MARKGNNTQRRNAQPLPLNSWHDDEEKAASNAGKRRRGTRGYHEFDNDNLIPSSSRALPSLSALPPPPAPSRLGSFLKNTIFTAANVENHTDAQQRRKRADDLYAAEPRLWRSLGPVTARPYRDAMRPVGLLFGERPTHDGRPPSNSAFAAILEGEHFLVFQCTIRVQYRGRQLTAGTYAENDDVFRAGLGRLPKGAIPPGTNMGEEGRIYHVAGAAAEALDREYKDRRDMVVQRNQKWWAKSRMLAERELVDRRVLRVVAEGRDEKYGQGRDWHVQMRDLALRAAKAFLKYGDSLDPALLLGGGFGHAFADGVMQVFETPAENDVALSRVGVVREPDGARDTIPYSLEACE